MPRRSAHAPNSASAPDAAPLKRIQSAGFIGSLVVPSATQAPRGPVCRIPGASSFTIWPMHTGLQFFPDVAPRQKSAAQYFDECLRLVDLADDYGYSHIRIVEHYFDAYGGYSPNPMIFLAAAAQRTRKARLVTG